MIVKRVTLTVLIVGVLLVLLPALSTGGDYVPGVAAEIRSTTHPPDKPPYGDDGDGGEDGNGDEDGNGNGVRTEKATDGAKFVLWVSFTPEWSSLGKHWQELWTVVQWQDDMGEWFDVEQWQGTLDSAENGKAWKEWWVDHKDYGKGPFRWLVLESPGGKVLRTLPEFYLPAGPQERVVVEVSVP